MNSRIQRQKAFTLVELLVVVAIIGIIGSFAIPAAQTMLKSSSLVQASNLLVDQMSLARQHALSKNRIVEVRFYKYADLEAPGESATNQATWAFRGFQFFEIGEHGVIMPVSKFTSIPSSIVMSDKEKLSPLLIEPTAAGKSRIVVHATAAFNVKTATSLPQGIGHNYDYVPFHFLPDGTTSLSPAGVKGKASEGGRWFITLYSVSDAAKATADVPPPNFFTWMVDPTSGTSKTFRPEVGKVKK